MLSALVIDNDPSVAQQLCRLLELLDVAARPAYNPKAAWLGVDQKAPDLVFLSTTFSEECWTSLLDKLCGDPRLENVPIVMVSPGIDRDLRGSKKVLDIIKRPASLEAIETSLRKAGYY